MSLAIPWVSHVSELLVDSINLFISSKVVILLFILTLKTTFLFICIQRNKRYTEWDNCYAGTCFTSLKKNVFLLNFFIRKLWKSVNMGWSTLSKFVLIFDNHLYDSNSVHVTETWSLGVYFHYQIVVIVNFEKGSGE